MPLFNPRLLWGPIALGFGIGCAFALLGGLDPQHQKTLHAALLRHALAVAQEIARGEL